MVLLVAVACDPSESGDATSTETIIPEATTEAVVATLEAELSMQATVDAAVPTIEALLGEFATEEAQISGALRVTRVIDGDTVDVCCPEARVRLLGIDAPESGEPHSDEAIGMVERLTQGQPIRLEKCEEEADRYGRLLRHAFVGGTHVNRELVEAGLARAYDFSLNLNPCYEDELREAESEAQWEGLGMWE